MSDLNIPNRFPKSEKDDTEKAILRKHQKDLIEKIKTAEASQLPEPKTMSDTQRLNYLELLERDNDEKEKYPYLVASMNGELCYGKTYREALDIAAHSDVIHMGHQIGWDQNHDH